jgi:hypothetical protein
VTIFEKQNKVTTSNLAPRTFLIISCCVCGSCMPNFWCSKWHLLSLDTDFSYAVHNHPAVSPFSARHAVRLLHLGQFAEEEDVLAVAVVGLRRRLHLAHLRHGDDAVLDEHVHRHAGEGAKEAMRGKKQEINVNVLAAWTRTRGRACFGEGSATSGEKQGRACRSHRGVPSPRRARPLQASFRK